MAVSGEQPVADDEILLRWVQPKNVDPGDSGQPMSEVFRKAKFSTDRETIKPLEQFRAEHSAQYVVRIRVADCLDLGYAVKADPLPNGLNDAHTLVLSNHSQNALRRAAKQLRDRSRNEFYPPLQAEERE